jgi:hypothetical protein
MTESDKLWAQLTKKFMEVRDALHQTEHKTAYRMSFKQPWKFYHERTVQEAIEELIRTYGA